MNNNIYRLKNWIKMIFGKSILHVNQKKGTLFAINLINGYYNDLTQKVTKDKAHYSSDDVFSTEFEHSSVYFPIAIFQYGLGAYDLYISKKDSELMKRKVLSAANWALKNQKATGAWDSFSFLYPNDKYSAMCQGEGASLLYRAYNLTKDDRYLSCAKKAIDFIFNSDLSKSEDGCLYLYEYTNKPFVFNGSIFAAFGLYDTYLQFGDKMYLDYFNMAVNALIANKDRWDCGYWSNYDCGSSIASPFYHKLHIALLEALYDLTSNEDLKAILTRFKKYNSNPFYKIKAFLKKANQKVKEK